MPFRAVLAAAAAAGLSTLSAADAQAAVYTLTFVCLLRAPTHEARRRLHPRRLLSRWCCLLPSRRHAHPRRAAAAWSRSNGPADGCGLRVPLI
jgi:hypothetical protein